MYICFLLCLSGMINSLFRHKGVTSTITSNRSLLAEFEKYVFITPLLDYKVEQRLVKTGVPSLQIKSGFKFFLHGIFLGNKFMLQDFAIIFP